MREVAERAGVSISTVSRALTVPDRVNEQTRELVESIAREVGYRAPSHPRERPTVSGTVAVLTPDLANPFFFDVIRGVLRELRPTNRRPILVETEESADIERRTLAELRGLVDGVVILASRLSDRELGRWAQRLPLVVMNRPGANIASALIDTSTTAGHAIDHLVSLGHRRIAYVSGPPESWSNQQRSAAAAQSARRHGVELITIGPYSPRGISGPPAADALITTGATACLVYNDMIALGMLPRLRERGISVPEGMSVVGCDDIFAARLTSPALTTITAPLERTGRAAASLLLEQMLRSGSGQRRSSIVVPSHLTIRDSTAAPA
jgi:LacI family transcriptional regulator